MSTYRSIFVNDEYDGLTAGTQVQGIDGSVAIFGESAFASLEQAVAAKVSNAVIRVESGKYESVDASGNVQFYVADSQGSVSVASQVVFVNFEGGADLSYDNGAYSRTVTMQSAGYSAEEQRVIIDTLNTKGAAKGIVYVTEAVADASTIYVGATDSFDDLGTFKGLSETIDKGNLILNDEAFVNTKYISSAEEAAEVIAHEAGHLTGEEHGVTTNTIADYAWISVYSTVDFSNQTHSNNYRKYNDGAVIVIGSGGNAIGNNVTFTNNTAQEGGGVIKSTGNGKFNFTNSTFSNNRAIQSMGGAIAIESSGLSTLTNCTFTGNTAHWWGGAISAAGPITVQNCLFSNNSTLGPSPSHGRAGAIICNNNLTITGGTFTNNTANYRGGAIENNGGTASMTGGTFTGNTAKIDGGAIYNRGTFTMEGVTFSENTAQNGGAIYNYTTGKLTFNDSNVIFAGNTVSGGTVASGGAIYNAGIINMAGGTFTGNTAAGYALHYGNGGAIYNAGTISMAGGTFSENASHDNGGAIKNDGTMTFTAAATFSGNSSSEGDGGAIMNGDNGTLTFNDTVIFDGNMAEFGSGGALKCNSGTTVTFNGAVTFSGNTGGIGGAVLICSTSTVNFNDNVTFNGNRADGSTSGAIQIEPNAIVNFAKTMTLATETDTILVESNLVAPAGTLNWNLAASGEAKLVGFNMLNNNGGTLSITVNAWQTAGDYVIATGATSALTGKDTFTVKTADDAGVALTVDGNAVQYSHRTYALTLSDGNLTLSVTPHRIVVTTQDYDLGTDQTYTIPTASTNGGAVLIQSGASALGSNLTFSGNTATEYGGALDNKGTLTVTNNVIFTGNTAGTEDGGAIFNSGTISMAGGTFSENKAAQKGGAIYTTPNKTITFNDTVIFADNTAGTSGGAILNNGPTIIKGGTFTGNTAGSIGGAISNTKMLTFNDTVIFDGNTAGSMAGAIYNAGTVSMAGGTFTSNTTEDGGAIYNASMLTISDTVIFAGNTANTGIGGAIGNVGTLNMEGGTFSENTAAQKGGAIYNDNSGTITFDDTVSFTGNTAGTESGGAIYNAGTISMAGGTFSTNKAYGGSGGAIENHVGTMTFSAAAEFSGNEAEYGGAVDISWNGTLTFNDTVSFTGNTAGENGGALSSSGSTATFNGAVTFTGNQAQNGGAVDIYGSTVNFNDTVTFDGNIATDETNSGAVYIETAAILNFAKTMTLVTDTDTILVGSAGTLNWNLAESGEAKLEGFDKLTNNGGTLSITVDANLAKDDYVIATGVTSVTGKDTFTVKTADDYYGETLTVGGDAIEYQGRTYQLVHYADMLALRVDLDPEEGNVLYMGGLVKELYPSSSYLKDDGQIYLAFAEEGDLEATTGAVLTLNKAMTVNSFISGFDYYNELYGKLIFAGQGETTLGEWSSISAKTITINEDASVIANGYEFDFDTLTINGELTIDFDAISAFDGNVVEGNGKLHIATDGEWVVNDFAQYDFSNFAGTVDMVGDSMVLGGNEDHESESYFQDGATVKIGDGQSVTLKGSTVTTTGIIFESVEEGNGIIYIDSAKILTADNSGFTGLVEVSGGTALTLNGALGADITLGDGEKKVTFNNADYTYSGKITGDAGDTIKFSENTTLSGAGSISDFAGTVTVDAGKTLTFTKSVDSDALITGEGKVVFDADQSFNGDGALNNHQGELSISSGKTLTLTGSNETAATLTGAGSIDASDDLTLKGDNSGYTGKVTMDEGSTLTLKNAFGGNVVLGVEETENVTTLALDSDGLTFGGTVEGDSDDVINVAKSVTLSGNAALTGFAGTVQVNANTLTLSGTASAATSAKFTGGTAGTMAVTGNQNFGAAAALDSYTGIVSIDDGKKLTLGGANETAAKIIGKGAIAANGNLTLSADNSGYTGTVTMAEGKTLELKNKFGGNVDLGTNTTGITTLKLNKASLNYAGKVTGDSDDIIDVLQTTTLSNADALSGFAGTVKVDATLMLRGAATTATNAKFSGDKSLAILADKNFGANGALNNFTGILGVSKNYNLTLGGDNATAAEITGTGSISANGNLTLSGGGSFSGTVTMAEGKTLELKNAFNGDVVLGTDVSGVATTLKLNEADLNYSKKVTGDSDDVINVAANAELSGADTLTLFGGTVQVNANTLTLSGDATAATSAKFTGGTAGSLAVTGDQTFSAADALKGYNGSLSISENKTLTLSGDATAATNAKFTGGEESWLIISGDQNFGAAAALDGYSGLLDIDSDKTLTLGGTNTTAAAFGGYGFIAANANQTLTGDNASYDGIITMAEGTTLELQNLFGGDIVLGTTATGVTTLKLNGSNFFYGHKVTGDSDDVINVAKDAQLSNANALSGFGGTVNVNENTLILSGTASDATNAKFTGGTSSEMTVVGNQNFGAEGALNDFTGTLDVNSGKTLTLGGANTTAAVLSGAGAIAANANQTFTGSGSGYIGTITMAEGKTLTLQNSFGGNVVLGTDLTSNVTTLVLDGNGMNLAGTISGDTDDKITVSDDATISKAGALNSFHGKVDLGSNPEISRTLTLGGSNNTNAALIGSTGKLATSSNQTLSGDLSGFSGTIAANDSSVVTLSGKVTGLKVEGNEIVLDGVTYGTELATYVLLGTGTSSLSTLNAGATNVQLGAGTFNDVTSTTGKINLELYDSGSGVGYLTNLTTNNNTAVEFASTSSISVTGTFTANNLDFSLTGSNSYGSANLTLSGDVLGFNKDVTVSDDTLDHEDVSYTIIAADKLSFADNWSLKLDFDGSIRTLKIGEETRAGGRDWSLSLVNDSSLVLSGSGAADPLIYVNTAWTGAKYTYVYDQGTERTIGMDAAGSIDAAVDYIIADENGTGTIELTTNDTYTVTTALGTAKNGVTDMILQSREGYTATVSGDIDAGTAETLNLIQLTIEDNVSGSDVNLNDSDVTGSITGTGSVSLLESSVTGDVSGTGISLNDSDVTGSITGTGDVSLTNGSSADSGVTGGKDIVISESTVSGGITVNATGASSGNVSISGSSTVVSGDVVAAGTLNISGGMVTSSEVVAGKVNDAALGATSVKIVGSDDKGTVVAGRIVGGNAVNSGTTDQTQAASVTVDSNKKVYFSNSIYAAGEVLSGGVLNVSGNRSVTFTGLGSNLSFRNVVSGGVFGANTGTVSGTATLYFADFNGTFNGSISAFDEIVLSGSTKLQLGRAQSDTSATSLTYSIDVHTSTADAIYKQRSKTSWDFAKDITVSTISSGVSGTYTLVSNTKTDFSGFSFTVAGNENAVLDTEYTDVSGNKYVLSNANNTLKLTYTAVDHVSINDTFATANNAAAKISGITELKTDVSGVKQLGDVASVLDKYTVGEAELDVDGAAKKIAGTATADTSDDVWAKLTKSDNTLIVSWGRNENEVAVALNAFNQSEESKVAGLTLSATATALDDGVAVSDYTKKDNGKLA